ncbi:unnamed protein product [Lasius platythorax]|uniref:Uncharacterized protein n=1 Tax=Lasius platythorax TaxID=488582 RepID=A0AAV2NLJ9_9HYME
MSVAISACLAFSERYRYPHACRQTASNPRFFSFMFQSPPRGQVSNKFVTLHPGIRGRLMPPGTDVNYQRFTDLDGLGSTKPRYVEVVTREKNYGENDQKRSLLPGGLPHRRFLCLHCAVLTSLLVRTLSNVDAALTTCQ